nr:MAG TPA: hypothetical protein [Caudoviricetes sp.]
MAKTSNGVLRIIRRTICTIQRRISWTTINTK